MFWLSFFVTYRNPVILLPPFYGTNLWVTYNQANLPLYCSKSKNDSLLWLNTAYMLPLKMSCLFKLITTFIDDEGHITNWPNTTISIHDFGGDESTKFVIQNELLFRKGFGPSLLNFVEHFTELGWQLKKDLFIAPYDWRIGPTFSDQFWPDFRKLIEDAYSVQNEKVTIIAFSQGGYMTHHFLTKHCTQKWKDDFISQVILLSPSFAGDIQMLYNLWSKRIPSFPYVHSDAQSLCFEQMPSIHAHIPNEVVYKDVVLVYGPNGEEYKAGDLRDVIFDHLLFNENARKTFDKSQEIRKERPADLGVKTTLLMNSKRETAVALNFSNGWNKNPVRIIGEGDGTMPAYGHRWVCKHFNNITCIDFNSTSAKYDHYPLISTKRVLNIVSNITLYNKIPDLESKEVFVKDFDEL